MNEEVKLDGLVADDDVQKERNEDFMNYLNSIVISYDEPEDGEEETGEEGFDEENDNNSEATESVEHNEKTPVEGEVDSFDLGDMPEVAEEEPAAFPEKTEEEKPEEEASDEVESNIIDYYNNVKSQLDYIQSLNIELHKKTVELTEVKEKIAELEKYSSNLSDEIEELKTKIDETGKSVNLYYGKESL